mgnify:CR=1 FL=1
MIWFCMAFIGRTFCSNLLLKQSFATCLLIWLGAVSVTLGSPPDEDRTNQRTSRSSSIRVYRSAHFRLHTDLSEPDARSMLVDMESTLDKVATYWRQPVSGIIDAYIIDDLANWSSRDHLNPMTQLMLQHIGGVTIPIPTPKKREPFRQRALMYAISRPDVVRHEVVHAYCCQTFGYSGPDWYKEGMADTICMLPDKQGSVRCPQEVLDSLQSENVPSVNDIIHGPSFTDPLFETIKRAASLVDGNEQSVVAALPSAWGSAEDEMLRKAKQSYAHSWALCHFLLLNKNYNKRFRQLGHSFLQNAKLTFDQVFSNDRDQLEFEFQLFLQNIAQGYQVGLCRWQWDKPFIVLEPGNHIAILIQAAAGYQPTGCTVEQGGTYSFHTEGTWQISPQGKQLNADGNHHGDGQLAGVILSDYRVTENLLLGQSSHFISKGPGQLHVRCQDRWSEIADNAGFVRLTIKREK